MPAWDTFGVYGLPDTVYGVFERKVAGFTYPAESSRKFLSKVISGYPISPAQGSNISPASHRHSLLLVSAYTTRSSAASSAMAHVQSATNKLVWQLLPPGSPLHIATMWGTNALPGVFQIRPDAPPHKRGPSIPAAYCCTMPMSKKRWLLVPSLPQEPSCCTAWSRRRLRSCKVLPSSVRDHHLLALLALHTEWEARIVPSSTYEGPSSPHCCLPLH